MRRKLVKQGENALTVTLPAKWIKNNNLKPSDEIDVELQKNALIIKTAKEPSIKKYQLDIKGLEPFTKRVLSALYKKEIDELEVFFPNKDAFKQIEQATSELMGFEIVNREKNSCTIKNIAGELEPEFENILRRTFLILISMSESIYEASRKGDYAKLEEAKLLEETNNRFTDFLKRQLNRVGYYDQTKTIFLYCIIRDLEKICDEYKSICENVINNEIKLTKKTNELILNVNNFVRTFYELFYKFDKNELVDFKKQKDDLNLKILNHHENCPKKETVVLYNLMSILNLLYDALGPLFALKL